MNTIYILFLIMGVKSGGVTINQEFDSKKDCEVAKAALYDRLRPRLDTDIMLIECRAKGEFAKEDSKPATQG